MMGFTCKSGLYYFKTYPLCCSAFALAIIGSIALIIAILSPFWLVSKEGSDSDFVCLGLWKICFKKYQHPALDFPHILDGCYPLHRHKDEAIRNWLQPVWFTIVQCLVTSALFLSLLCICLIMYMVCQDEMEIKIFVAAFVFLFEAVSAFIVFLGVCIFGVMSFERTWIDDPSSVALSWSFCLSVLAAMLMSSAACCLLIQIVRMRKVLARDNRGTYHIPLSNRNMSY